MASTHQSETGKLRSVILKHVKEAFKSQEFVDRQWQKLNYLARPDFLKAAREYDRLVRILDEQNVEIQFLPPSDDTGIDSIYVRDASIVTDNGLVICEMGKAQRMGEPQAHLNHCLSSGVNLLGTIQSPGTIEGGDVAWINEHILGVAHGYRTNKAGIDQLKNLLEPGGTDLMVMDSPHYKGPEDVFHLMSVFSPVDKDLAVVYSPLMAVPFRNGLIELGFDFVEVPDEEFDSLGCNVLALEPRKCLMVKGNPVTRSRLEKNGVEVIEFKGDEICLKGSGGPTCLTRPLLRTI